METKRLLIVVTILISIGIVMVYSSSSCYGYDNFNDSAFYLKKQLVHFIIGLLLSAVVIKADYKRIRKYAKVLLFLGIFSLFLVLIPGIGREAGGAKRWIKLGFLGFQPSEAAGLFLIIYLADLLERKQAYIKNFAHGFLPPIIVTGFVVVLILIQPDLGSAVSILTVAVIMMFIAGADIRHFIPFIISFIPVLYFMIAYFPYRLRRITGYLDPWGDAQNTGFQIAQSFLALGAGGLFGRGLGCSRQKLFYLPQSHTDFIFSIIGEELGFIGTIGIVVLFSIFVWLGIKISMKANNLFGSFLAIGITFSIGLKALINIAVSTGAIPTKGMPLPFISYGGTALIFNMISAAILLNISDSK